jgi:acylphosphatase
MVQYVYTGCRGWGAERSSCEGGGDAMTGVRKRVIVSGWVQGVFFRASLLEKAIANNVRGWVRNTPEGDVEAVLEGEEPKVERVIAWCHRGPSGAVVENVEVLPENYTGEFSTFSITYSRR